MLQIEIGTPWNCWIQLHYLPLIKIAASIGIPKLSKTWPAEEIK